MPIRYLPHTRFARANRKRAAGYPSILEDGNTVAWFDKDEYVTKDGSDLVSVWGDKSGNSNDLEQATGTNQPLWSADGILFDGVDNFMKTSPFTLEQPEFIYMVVKQVSWTAGDAIFDGNVSNVGVLQQNTVTPNLRAYAGSLSSEISNLTIGTLSIVRLLFNGASSKLIIDETTPITGDFGSTDMNGFTLGSQGDGAGSYGNILTPEAIVRKSTVGEADIFSYLKSKYGTP